MTTIVVPMPVTIDLDAALFDTLSDEQLGLYMRLTWLTSADSSGIALIQHTTIKPVKLAELYALGLIRCSFGRTWSYVSMVVQGVDSAWR